jgi:ribosomal-protein-alanine N-acetyltransferase
LNIFKTTRLTIRQITLNDIDGLACILTDPQVMRYSTVGTLNHKQILAYIDNCQQQYLCPGYGHWAICNTDSNEFIGVCGLHPLNLDNTELQHINYRLALKHQGQGFATEACAGVLQYASSNLGISNV